MEQTATDIKAKIAELRQRYSKLRMFCGRQHISQQTINEYSTAIKQLEAQLN
ncbi:MAG: hypothetical protein Q7S74_04780 [Nanoarchaeota archaeon]|nr:hypothetical protein [Nanoarchaeota archaeon]